MDDLHTSAQGHTPPPDGGHLSRGDIAHTGDGAAAGGLVEEVVN